MRKLFAGETSSLMQAVIAVLPGKSRRDVDMTSINDDTFTSLADDALEQAMLTGRTSSWARPSSGETTSLNALINAETTRPDADANSESAK